MATPEQRPRVRNFLFQDGLSYLPEPGISNTSNSCLCTLLEAMTVEKEVMVRPERFELPTCCSGGNRSIQLSYGRTDHYSLHG